MNGRTRHIHAKHPSDDNLQDLPVVPEMWPRSSSPQTEAIEDDDQPSNDFEPPTACNFDQVSNTLSSDDNNFQPQREELPEELPEVFSSSPPLSRHSTSLQDTEESIHTEYHPTINGEYIVIKFHSTCPNKLLQANDATKVEHHSVQNCLLLLPRPAVQMTGSLMEVV